MDVADLKQQFILELMTFSPKYNIVSSEQVVDALSEEVLATLLARLRLINDAEAKKLSALEESDPEEYARRLKARKEAEEKADDAFFSALEQKLLADAEPLEKKLMELEREIDSEADAADASIDKDFSTAEEMIASLLQEIEKEEQQVENPQETTTE